MNTTKRDDVADSETNSLSRADANTTDHRSPLARARDQWVMSVEGLRCLNGAADGVYLRNRLECAFIAGWDAAERAQKGT